MGFARQGMEFSFHCNSLLQHSIYIHVYVFILGTFEPRFSPTIMTKLEPGPTYDNISHRSIALTILQPKQYKQHTELVIFLKRSRVVLSTLFPVLWLARFARTLSSNFCKSWVFTFGICSIISKTHGNFGRSIS